MNNEETKAGQSSPEVPCSAWKPIETAPRSKKAILVWINAVKCPALVCWDEYLEPCAGWVHFHSYNQRLTRAPDLWMPYPEPNAKMSGE